MSEPLLEMNNIFKQFDGAFVLKDASIQLNRGEVHAIVGENGAGKTTLINILAGVLRPDSGEIVLDGKPISIENVKQAQQFGINAIYQNYDLFENMNIGENIFINQEPIIRLGPMHLINWHEVHRRTNEILRYLNLHIESHTQVRALSAGDKKFVEIARAMVNNSRIVIMDEPTASLTEMETQFLFRIIQHLKSNGISVIYISHRLNEINQIADRITVLRDGGTVAVINKNEFDSFRLIKLMVGDKIKDRYPKINLKIGKDVLIVKNMRLQKYRTNVSFSLRKGEILGITGLKGSGKTSVAKVLFGIEGPVDGSIYINGKLIRINHTTDAVRNGLCYIPSNRIDEGLVYNASVANNIVLPNLRSIVKHKLLSHQLKIHEAEKYVKMVGINLNKVTDPVRNLSGGNQKKVILAKWLFRNSKIIIMNEPTSSIDIAAKVDIYNIINELIMSGTSIIIISSELPELVGMCDRVLVMVNGAIVKELVRGSFSQEQILHYASGSEEKT